MPDPKLATIKRYWDSINAGDAQAYLDTFCADGVAHDPVTGPPLGTSAERRTFIEGLFDRFPRRRFTLDFVTACGDSTAAKWSLAAVGADGSLVVTEGIDVCRHSDDGRIRELWAYPEGAPASEAAQGPPPSPPG